MAIQIASFSENDLISIRKLLKKYIQYIRYDPKKFWNKHGGENYIKKFHPSSERNEG